MHNPQVLLSPILNDYPKLNLDGHTRLQIVPKLLLKVSIQELHNRLVGNPEYSGFKEARDA